MDTIEGDKFVADCARFIRYNEAKLGDVVGTSASVSSALTTSLTWMNPTSWLMAGVPPGALKHQGELSGSSAGETAKVADAKPRPAAVLHRPMPFRITNHHLYYLLIRCEALGLPGGPLDVKLPARSRPSSYFAFISNQAAGATMRKRDREETMSISSLQTTMSAFGLTGGRAGSTRTGTSWWSSERPDVAGDLKYIYSAMTKLPALRIGPPPLKLVRDFEDCPGELSVSMDAFKNVHILEFEDNDPRTYIGWDRLAMQLRSLSMKRSGIEDVRDIIIDAVVNDTRRRRGDQTSKQRIDHASQDSDLSKIASTTSSEQQREAEHESNESERLPGLSWHFLRHLSLADNGLTFIHSAPMSCLLHLTSLDLSNNLLNAVPPSLSVLTKLRSLNLSNNLIESVLGIPDSIPNIQALNLSHNRLESLCGLERLKSLSRIDLRHNEIFEAGEIGRLATLNNIAEIFIAENPLMEEEDAPRVLVLTEFAKEGRDIEKIILDGDSIGYFERQKIREAVPNLDRLVKARAASKRNHTPLALEVDKPAKNKSNDGEHERHGRSFSSSRPIDEEEARAAHVSVIKSVRHRGQGHIGGRSVGPSESRHQDSSFISSTSNKGKSPLDSKNDERSTSPSGLGSSNSRIAGGAQRRNRRVVELAESVHESQLDEESDSDKIKRAALSGDLDVAIGITSLPDDVIKGHGAIASGKTTSSMDTRDDKEGTYRDARMESGQEKESKSVVGGGDKREKGKIRQSAKENAEYTSQIQGQDLRRKIEALKGEVGDDWMRLLARGESA